MKIHINGRKIDLDEGIRAYIERRVQFSMGRLSHKIHSVRVQVSDVNGPKGGRDKECRVEVRMRTEGSLTTKAVEVDLHVAVAHALERAGYAVSQWAKRTRAFDRTTPRIFEGASFPVTEYAGGSSVA